MLIILFSFTLIKIAYSLPDSEPAHVEVVNSDLLNRLKVLQKHTAKNTAKNIPVDQNNVRHNGKDRRSEFEAM